MTRRTVNTMAAVGLALLFTPGLFITASILKYQLGVGFLYDALASVFSSRAFDRASPVLLLGGLVLALGLNVYAVADLSYADQGGSKRRVANFVVIAASALLLTVLVGYLFLENFAR